MGICSVYVKVVVLKPCGAFQRSFYIRLESARFTVRHLWLDRRHESTDDRRVSV